MRVPTIDSLDSPPAGGFDLLGSRDAAGDVPSPVCSRTTVSSTCFSGFALAARLRFRGLGGFPMSVIYTRIK